MKKLMVLLVLAAIAMPMVGCSKKSDSEKAKSKVEKAAKDVGKAADKAGKAATKAIDDMKE